MSLRTNLVVGVIFLALLSFVYFYEIKGGEQRKAEAKRAKELLSFQDGAARRITLVRGDSVVVLQKEGGQWRLVMPVQDLADQQAVERLLRNLRESERERVVADSAEVAAHADLVAKYGLDSPRLRVVLDLDEGPLDTLVVGADTPTNRYTYMQQRGADPEIFVVRAWRFDNLDKGAFDLRDRRVLPFDRDKVQEIRLDRPQDSIVLQKGDGSAWSITAPVRGRGDAEAVRSLLSRLENGKIKAFVEESATEERLAALGLAPPSTFELSLLVGEERAEKRLRVGNRTSAGAFYARDMSAPQVFTVDSLLVKDLDKPLDDLRDKKLLTFDRDRVDRIEIERPGEEKVAAAKDTADVWAVIQPRHLPAKSWKLSGLLTDLEQLKAGGFAAPDDSSAARAAPSLLTVSLYDDSTRVAQVHFAEASRDTVLAFCADDPVVYRLAKGDYGKVDLRLEDLAEIAVAPADSDSSSSGI